MRGHLFIRCPFLSILQTFWNPQKFAESTRYYHRTLQQELMKTIVAIIKMVGDKGYRTDLRNQASHELCRKIIDSGVLDDCYLPFI